jgi:hypothetical protein
MPFDIKSFKEQVRPSPRRPSPAPFNNSVFDAGSPQYVRPEDLFLDIQSRLFGVTPRASHDLGGIDPSDFRTRWMREGVSELGLQRIGSVADEELAESAMHLLRTPKRKNERYRTLLPVVPALGFYKNIKPNLPNFLNDQLRPALSFADEVGFGGRVARLKEKLAVGSHGDDSLKRIAIGLLPPPRSANVRIDPSGVVIGLHDGPLLKDFCQQPSRSLSICTSLKDALDTLLDLETRLPRILWARWMSAAMRFWLPLFFLRRCSVTAIAANAARVALMERAAPTAVDLSSRLCNANGLLRGSREWLNQLTPIVQNYVRARFEISILIELGNLQQRLSAQGIDVTKSTDHERAKQELAAYEVNPANATNTSLPQPAGIFVAGNSSVQLSMPNDQGARRLPFDEWLKWMVENLPALDALAALIGAQNSVDLVERVYGYIRPEYEPLKSGFGKNAYEYVAFALGAPRKVDRDPEFPDEYNLIYRGEGGRRARHVVVQPGPQLLTLLVQIVAWQAKSQFQTTAKLSDLLDLFDSVGLDFRSNPDDFEGLKSELLRLGLLQSSADAAEAASLNPSYSF